jgi:hypothetical protein
VQVTAVNNQPKKPYFEVSLWSWQDSPQPSWWRLIDDFAVQTCPGHPRNIPRNFSKSWQMSVPVFPEDTAKKLSQRIMKLCRSGKGEYHILFPCSQTPFKKMWLFCCYQELSVVERIFPVSWRDTSL